MTSMLGDHNACDDHAGTSLDKNALEALH